MILIPVSEKMHGLLHYQCISFPPNNLLSSSKGKERAHPSLLPLLMCIIRPGAAKTRCLKDTAASSLLPRAGMQKSTTAEEVWMRSGEVPTRDRHDWLCGASLYLGELWEQGEMRLSCLFS